MDFKHVYWIELAQDMVKWRITLDSYFSVLEFVPRPKEKESMVLY
jgi:hypothetical protein